MPRCKLARGALPALSLCVLVLFASCAGRSGGAKATVYSDRLPTGSDYWPALPSRPRG
jgi:hypothetical protein